jgi:endonuclease III
MTLYDFKDHFVKLARSTFAPVLNIGSMVTILERFYGALSMPPRDPFTSFVYEVLSAQTAPGRRDAAMGALRRIPALTPDSLWRAPRKKVEEAVLLAGPYFDQRMGALRTGAELFRRNPRLPEAIRAPLGRARRAVAPLPRPGGAAGAHRLLLFAGGHLVFPLDAGVRRVAERLGLGSHPGQQDENARRAVRSIRRAVIAQLPPAADAYRHAVVYLSHHSSAVCTEADPHCGVCPLLTRCLEGPRRLARTAGPG